MADLIQLAQSGVNPVTGSYLSAENRKKLFRLGRSRVSSSVFGGGGAIVPVRSKIDPEKLGSIVKQDNIAISNLQAQVQALSLQNAQLVNNFKTVALLQNQINILRVTVTDLTKKLQEIGGLIDNDTKLEQQRDTQELEDERKLVQRNIRQEKEGLLEKKIQSALVAPVRAISERVKGTLQSLMEFFGTLFVGWLTNQGIEALRASFNGNKRKLDDIKNSVIRNLAIVGGIFAIFKFGIGTVISSIARVSAKVAQFVMSNTIGRLFQGLKNLVPGAGGGKPPSGGGAIPTPPGRGGGKPPTPGGKPGGKPAGGFGTFIGATLEAIQGNWAEAALGAGAFLPGLPGKIFKGAFWLEQGLDLFGKGVINDPQTPEVTQNNTTINNDYSRQSIRVNASQTAPDISSPRKPTASTPQSPMVDAPKINLNPNQQNNSTPTEPLASSPKIEQNKMADVPDAKPQQSLAPQSQELQFNVDTSEKLNLFGSNPEKLLDFSKPPLYGRVDISQSGETGTTSEENKTPTISSPIKQQGVQTLPFDIGPLPEPKPNVVYRRTGNESPQNASSPQLKVGAASEVPNISSSNSNNMYILYSQVNYNVVM